MSEGGESKEQPESTDLREGRSGWTRERGWLSPAQWAENEIAQKELDNAKPLDRHKAPKATPEKKPIEPKKVDNLPPLAPLKWPK